MMTTTDPGCGKTYRLRGNKTGHCTRCHRTFHGIAAFDQHQRAVPSATAAPYSECLDPAEIRSAAGQQVYESRSEPDSTDGLAWALVVDEARKAQWENFRNTAKDGR